MQASKDMRDFQKTAKFRTPNLPNPNAVEIAES